MHFEELGEILRLERERCGLSIEAAAGRLKLMPRIVRAMEQGDVETLPQAAYARGFLKAYGRLLDIDPETLSAAIEAAWPDDDAPAAAYDMPAERGIGERGKVRGFLLALVIVLVAGGAFWYFRDLDMSRSGAVRTATPVMPAPAESAVRAAQGAGPPAENRAAQPAPSSAAPQASAPAAARDQRPAPAAEKAQEAAASPPAAAALSGPHQLVIIALAECWVHSAADETDTRQFSLRKGDTFVLPFTKKLELRLGNAGGVRLRFDGRDMPPPGESGQVKNLVFPPAP